MKKTLWVYLGMGSFISTEREQTETEGGPREKEKGHVILWRRSDNSHGPSMHLTPYTVHSGCSVCLGQCGKNLGVQAKAYWSFAGLAGFLSKKCDIKANYLISWQDGNWADRWTYDEDNNEKSYAASQSAYCENNASMRLQYWNGEKKHLR